MLPSVFAMRSKYGTPTFSILYSASGVIFLSWMSFQEILEFLNFLYAVGMQFEFAAFIKLQIDNPDLHRPYKVPLNTVHAAMLCLPPVFLLLLVMSLASFKTYLVSGAVILLGFASYLALLRAKERKWMDFITVATSNDPEGQPVLSEEDRGLTDEAPHGLLADFTPFRMSHGGDISAEELMKVE